MIGRRHVRDLFGDAYDGTLTATQSVRFAEHLQGCARCADAFRRYGSGLRALATLPAARMPRAVHVPAPGVLPAAGAGAQPASRPRLWLSLSAGLATAAAVVTIAVVALHGVHPGATSSTANEAGGAAARPARSGCSLQLQLVPGAMPHVRGPSVSVSNASDPDATLVLAGSTAGAAPGSSVSVVVALVPAHGASGLPATTACVAIADAAAPAGIEAAVATPVQAEAQPASVVFSVPVNAPAGSSVRVAVTVYAGPSAATPLTAVLEIAVT